ncbi:MAG: Yip1 family protein [Anaerolineae bacterium]|jgi:hypothetical protein
MRFLKLFLSVITNPQKTLLQVKRDESRLGYAFLSLAVHSAFAMSKQLTFHLQSRHPEPEPWLRVATERTWLYSFYFNLPVDIIQAVIFAGVVTLAAKLFDGKGSFEGQFALYAFAFAPVNILFLYGAFALSLLGLDETLLWWAYFGVVLLWDLVLITLSVRVEQELKWGPALLCFVAGFAPAILLSLTYIR